MNARGILGGSDEFKAGITIIILLSFVQVVARIFESPIIAYPAPEGDLYYGSMQGIRPYHGTLDESFQSEHQGMPSSTPTSYAEIIGYCQWALGLFLLAKHLYRMWQNVPEQDQLEEMNEVLDESFSDSEGQDNILSAPVEDNEHEKRLAAVGFNGDIPAGFLDPIDRTIMFNPVILLTSDHTTTRSFEEMSILRLMHNNDKPVCPLSRRPFNGYILNRDLKQLIDEWVEQTVRAAQSVGLNEMPRQRAESIAQMSQQFFKHRKSKQRDDQGQNYYSLRKSM